MVKAVLLNEKRNDVHEINVDLSPEKNEICKILRGKATFLGQWEEELVVILKCKESVFDLKLNENILPRPFSNMDVDGRILLIRMDEESEPQDFTKVEYDDMCKKFTTHDTIRHFQGTSCGLKRHAVFRNSVNNSKSFFGSSSSSSESSILPTY